MAARKAAELTRKASRVADDDDTTTLPHIIYRRHDGTVRMALTAAELTAALADPTGVLWADIDSSKPEQHEWLARVFHFHPLAIEDTLNPASRVKLEEYPGYIFTIIRGIRFDESTDDPYDLETFNLCFFLGSNFLVTTHDMSTAACDTVWERVAANPDLIERGQARIAHAVMDQAVDDYFPVLDRLDEFIDDLEERVFVRAETDVLRDIFSVKRLVLSMRRHLQPQREVLNALTNRPTPLLPVEVQLYFRDVYDHVLRITDSLDTYRELLSSTLDSSLTQTSNRLATVTKTLSVMATLSIPFVMVSGIWGMNFTHIPLQHAPYGFWIMLFLQALMGLTVVLGLKWKRLL